VCLRLIAKLRNNEVELAQWAGGGGGLLWRLEGKNWQKFDKSVVHLLEQGSYTLMMGAAVPVS